MAIFLFMIPSPISLEKARDYCFIGLSLLVPLCASAKTPFSVKASADWVAYDHSIEIEPGGVFDFSSLEDAPAGKHGRVIATPAGHFEFADRPGERVRFWGVNLVSSAIFLSKDGADRLAERLVRSGYNTVRLHHFDGPLVIPGGKSYELDPVKLDQLDYLFAALKKRGLYINIDLYSNRRFRDDELRAFGIDPKNVDKTHAKYLFKGIVPVSDAAFEAWSLYAKNLLTRRNPYTGLTWAEDPALIGICPINEDSPYARSGYKELSPLYQAAFEKWRALPENTASIPEGETAEQRKLAFNQFVYEASLRADQRMFAYLHSLGVNALLSGSNHRTSQGLTLVREHYDYVDNHQYWDHPRFPEKSWQLPYQYTQNDAITGPLPGNDDATLKDLPPGPRGGAAWVPRGMMPTRVLGKPFVVTEINFVRPNRFRAEGGVLIPAYASLQDWDALYNFQYAMNAETAINGGVDNPFALVSDPIGLLADRISALLFRRGDIEPARGAVAYAVRPQEAFSEIGREFPEEFSRLGLVTRIGSRMGEPEEVLTQPGISAAVIGANFPISPKGYLADANLSANLERDGILPKGAIDTAGNRFVSDTGQIEMKADIGTLKVVTPRSELFVLPPDQQIEGGSVMVKNGSIFGAVSVISVDGEPIAQSKRLLVLHLTNALPTGMRFADQSARLLQGWGAFPQLVERGSVDLNIRLADGATYKAWAVDATGKRQREVPLEKTDAGWLLKAATVTNEGTQLAYEIARQ